MSKPGWKEDTLCYIVGILPDWNLCGLCFMFMSIVLRHFIALSAFLLSVCAWSEAPEKLTILSSIRPISLLVGDLVADLPVEVETLLPPNADPHNWAMRISDRQLLATADLVVWLGPDFENFLLKPIRELPPARHLEIGALPALQWPDGDISEDQAHHHHHGPGRDMHLWLNPANAVVILDALVERLAEMRPEWRPMLHERLLSEKEQLRQLVDTVQRKLNPHKEKGFIAYHDGYGHFITAFGLNQLAAVNQSAEQGMSAKKVSFLKLKAQGAKCLIVEQNSKPEQAMARTLKLPMRVANGLSSHQQKRYVDFLLSISTSFEECLKSELLP